MDPKIFLQNRDTFLKQVDLLILVVRGGRTRRFIIPIIIGQDGKTACGFIR